MPDPSETASPDPLFGLAWPWRWPGAAGSTLFPFAPERLWQPINPGWSFGNVVVNTGNSSAPEVEQRILSHHSYGRQIGRMMDALSAVTDTLVRRDPALAQDPCIADFRTLAADVRRLKQADAGQRLERLREDLLALKAEDPQAWKRLIASVR